MKPRVLVTRHVFQAAIPILQEVAAVDYRDSPEPMDEVSLGRRLRHAHGAVVQSPDPVTAAVLADAPHLRVVSMIGEPGGHVDLAAAAARGIVVTHTPGVATEAVADLTFALLLATARRLPAAERALRAGEWRQPELERFCGSDVQGRTLGLVGFGRVGRAVARRAMGFGMRVLYASPEAAPQDVVHELRALHVPLDLLLAQSDFVSVHVPGHPDARHRIGIEQLCRMKRSAFLIDTSRGDAVDVAALAAALEEGLLAGAGLDVPHPGSPALPALLALPNVVLLPDTGSAVVSVRGLQCALAAADCAAVLTGEPPKHPVSPEDVA